MRLQPARPARDRDNDFFINIGNSIDISHPRCFDGIISFEYFFLRMDRENLEG